jgi:hypothetical protein
MIFNHFKLIMFNIDINYYIEIMNKYDFHIV